MAHYPEIDSRYRGKNGYLANRQTVSVHRIRHTRLHQHQVLSALPSGSGAQCSGSGRRCHRLQLHQLRTFSVVDFCGRRERAASGSPIPLRNVLCHGAAGRPCNLGRGMEVDEIVAGLPEECSSPHCQTLGFRLPAAQTLLGNRASQRGAYAWWALWDSLLRIKRPSARADLP